MALNVRREESLAKLLRPSRAVRLEDVDRRGHIDGGAGG